MHDIPDYMHCLQAFETCSDASPRCAEFSLESCTGLAPEGRGSFREDLSFSAMNAVFGNTVFLWQLCPKTCGACEGQRQLDAAVTNLRESCQFPWAYADGYCFRYFDQPDRNSIRFESAQKRCEREQASLAEVDTPMKNQVVFGLLRRRSMESPYNSRGYSPWIGLKLRTGAECSADPQSWYWVASGRNLSSRYDNWARGGSPVTGMLYTTPTCASASRCAVLNFPNNNFYWHDVDCDSRLKNAWICSKPAEVRPAGFGSCDDLGMDPITSFDACEQALRLIDLPVRHLHPTFAVPMPEGCSMNMWKNGISFSLNPANRGRGSVLLDLDGISGKQLQMQVCQPKPNLTMPWQAWTPPTILPPSPPDTGAQKVQPVELLAALSVIGASLLMLLLRRWRALAAVATAGLHSTCFAYMVAWWRRTKPKSDDVLGAQVQLSLARRRQQLAVFAAGAHLTYRLLRFVLDYLANDAPCKSNRTARIGILGAEVLEICLSAALLASSPGRRRGVLIWCWVLVLPASRLSQAALMGGESLVAVSRPVEDLLWRLFHGVVMRPPVALAVNVLYMGGSLLMYRGMIPDGMVYFNDGSGCIQMTLKSNADLIHSAEALVDYAEGFLHTSVDDWRKQLAANLVSDLLQHTTSLARFAGVELFNLFLVFICLELLAHLMAAEMRSNIKLQNTENLFQAVSEMLQRLCDAVVHLDGSLTITRPSPRFAALLNCPTSTAARGGQSFCERLADRNEEERVRAALNAGQNAENTETLYTSFRDAFGVAVPCQIFHATFTSLDGQPSHVLGINEIGERDTVPLAPLKSSIQLAVGQQQPGHQAAVESRPLAQPQSDGGTPLASQSRATPSSSDTESDNSGAVERRLDMQLYDFTIVHANAGTTHLLSAGKDMAGRTLDSMVQATDEWQDLVKWQVETMQTLQVGELPEAKVQTVGPFHFWTTLRKEVRCYLVTLEVTFPDIDVESFDLETYTVSVRILSSQRVRENLPAQPPAPSRGGSSGGGRRRSRRPRRPHSNTGGGGTRASTERHGFSAPAGAEGEAEVASLHSDFTLGKESL